MEETLKLILTKLEKLDKIEASVNKLEAGVNKLEGNFNGLEASVNKLEGNFTGLEASVNKLEGSFSKMEADISALRADNKVIHKKLDMIIDEVANIKEQITDHEMKIQVISNKTKAI